MGTVFTGYHAFSLFYGIKLYEKSFKEKILIDRIEIKNAGCEYGEY
jgi:hypothetical protein